MKRASSIVIALLILCLTATAVFAGYEYNQKTDYKRYLQNNFQEAFYDTAKSVDEAKNVMSKLRLTNKSSQSIALFAQLWRQAAAAQENLGRLPYDHSIIDSVSKFLSQTSDFAYTMMNKNIDNQNLDEEDKKKLEQLYNYSVKLSEELDNTVSEVSMGNQIAWDKINAEEAVLEQADNQAETVPLLGSMSKVNQEFQEYPSLIYDGPFSEHLKTAEPLMTKGANKISSQDGIEIVRRFLHYDNITDIKFIGETDAKAQSVLPVYTYQAVLANNTEPTVYVEITQYGGLPVLMLNYTNTTGEKTINLEQAKQKAEEFLKVNGFENMESSYYESDESTAIINFAPVENEITMYSDLIKVKVDLNSGQITGFESRGYIMMHYDRQVGTPKFSEEQARNEISSNFIIEATKKCIIPLESKREVLCYEFKGTYENDSFLVYINANTGKQEKILQLLISDNAVLTQ